MFLKWPFIGMLVETFGFLNLFGCAAFACYMTVFDHQSHVQTQRLLPGYFNIPPPTTIHRQFPVSAIHSRRELPCN